MVSIVSRVVVFRTIPDRRRNRMLVARKNFADRGLDERVVIPEMRSKMGLALSSEAV